MRSHDKNSLLYFGACCWGEYFSSTWNRHNPSSPGGLQGGEVLAAGHAAVEGRVAEGPVGGSLSLCQAVAAGLFPAAAPRFPLAPVLVGDIGLGRTEGQHASGRARPVAVTITITVTVAIPHVPYQARPLGRGGDGLDQTVAPAAEEPPPLDLPGGP